MLNGLVSHPCVVDKNSGGISWEGYLSSEESCLTPGHPAQCSSARKISSHNFWLHKPVRIEIMEETSGAPSSSS